MPKLEYEDSFVKVAGLIGGEEYVKVARALLNNPDSTDEEIASATGLKINIVRRVLYNLYDKSLISAVRVKDVKRDWYVYRWRVQSDQVEVYLNSVKRRIVKRLKARLEYEKSHEFYHCGGRECPKRTFEEAVETMFICPNCGGQLGLHDNSEFVKALEWKIKQLEEELKSGKARRIDIKKLSSRESST
jgi:transcription initiation factor TFIIE subunit alpha